MTALYHLALDTGARKAELCGLLWQNADRHHKAQQAQLKLASRTTYQDFGLVFAKDRLGLRTHGATLGHPLQSNAMGQRAFKRLLIQAGIKAIKLYGLRHTCVTLLLQAGVPVHVVQEHLGHKSTDAEGGI